MIILHRIEFHTNFLEFSSILIASSSNLWFLCSLSHITCIYYAYLSWIFCFQLVRKLRKPESERKRYIVLAVDLFYRKVINEREGKPRLGACIIFAMVLVK